MRIGSTPVGRDRLSLMERAHPVVRDVAALGFATILVQGVIQLGQVICGRLLAPAEFAAIRTAEAAASMVLIAAALGMPTVAIRLGATDSGNQDSAHDTQALRLTTISGALWLVPLALYLILGAGLADPWVGLLIATTVIPGAITRTRLGYFQGLGRIGQLGRALIAISILSMVASVGGAVSFGARGWALGRVVAEIVACAAVVSLAPRPRVRAALPWARSHSRALIFEGAPMALALATRSGLDSFALLFAHAVGFSQADVGAIGFALLMLAIATLPVGIFSNVLLPRFIRAPGALATGLDRVTSLSVAIGASVGVITGAVCATLVPVLTTVGFSVAAPLGSGARLIFVAVPLRAVQSIMGARLYSLGKGSWTLGANFFLAAFSLLAVAAMGPRVADAAVAVVSVEALGAAVYAVLWRRATRPSAAQSGTRA